MIIFPVFFVILLARRYADTQIRRYADTQIRRYADTQIRRYADTQIGVPVMASNQLPEVIIGFAGPPHPRRISKLSRKYWCDKQHQLKQESMPVIPVNPNHPTASAARKRTPSAAVRESPPRAANARATNALMHGASASAPWPWLLLPLSLRTMVMPLVSLLLMPSLRPP